ncbi:MAG: N-formylglutamate amidohydrolase, partial [Planctomycetes bacterium]|nr:N-formylglutamate amidohydrolase [Planctomycetota bacterium]
MKLPLGISVPHAGLTIPDALVDRCRLTPAQIEADGDVGARRIYDFAERVTRYATTDVARAVLDLNRPRDDFRKDGVVKTHTCWDEPVWPEPLTGEIVAGLLRDH